jgi:hypothetical protein
VFCRHNRYTADCPICSKGTVLDPGRKAARRSAGGGGARREKSAAATPVGFSGKYVSAGPYRDDDDSTYEVRLERVPGGIRLAEWDGSGLRRRAPVLAADDMAQLVHAAAGVLDPRDASRLAAALPSAAPTEGSPQDHGEQGSEPRSDGDTPAGPSAAPGVSRGRSGDFKEELRVEDVGKRRLRIARWVLRPGSGWQLQEAPPMLPAARYAEALAGALAHGLLPAASDAGDAARL